MLVKRFDIFTVAVIYAAFCSTSCSLNVMSHNGSTALFKVTYDRAGNRVFVGGENILLQFSENLTVENSLLLSSLKESGDCMQENACANSISVLEVDHAKRTLLVCGSIQQNCFLHSLSNISNFKEVYNNSDSNLSGTKKSVEVLFYQKPSSTENIIFAAQEPDNHKIIFSIQDILALGDDYRIKFNVFDKEASLISAFGLSPNLRNYHMEIMGVFIDSNYVYFLTVQQKSLIELNKPYPRLGRICINDLIYQSYVEIGLLCQFGGNEYPRILAAVMHSNTLFFAAGRTLEQFPFKVDASKGSVVCAIPINRLNTIFAEVNYECYKNSGWEFRIPAWKSGRDQMCSSNPVRLVCLVFCCE